MPARSSTVVCEIHCANAVLAKALAQIAAACAKDTAQPIELRRVSAGAEPAITLRFPVELAVAQHPVWCLACRLACFCPDARVSVLIQGETAFNPQSSQPTRRRSA